MALSKQMERLLCSFSGDSLCQSLSIKNRLMAGLKLAELRGIREFGL